MAGPLTAEFIEAALRHLNGLAPRDVERWLHRWENGQPELTEALRVEAGEDVAVLEAADTLAFEVWRLLELAQIDRIRPVTLDEFQAGLAASDSPEPALERFVRKRVAGDAAGERAGRLVLAALRALARARSA